MGKNTLSVKLPQGQYNIVIKRGVINSIGENLKDLYKNQKIALISDDNVLNIHGKSLIRSLISSGFNVKVIKVRPGEKSKSIKYLQYIYDELLDFEITRSDLIVTFGGGVIGDLGGFVASTFLRGIPFIQIPTTLLSQVDSSVGGKVAVNLSRGKNLVGSFYHPVGVFIDPEVLNTLDKRYFYDGMAEVIKYGCIKDKELFNRLFGFKNEEKLLENIDDIIYTCCKIKAEIVERDERDRGERMLLNFGHTIGHGIERMFNYEGYTHGEAVAIGMYNITSNSEKMGITKVGTSRMIKDILSKYNLPSEMPNTSYDEMFKAVSLDKKSMGDSTNLILLKEIGESIIYQVYKNELHKFII